MILLFAQPISRVRLLSAEFAVTVGGVVVLHCSAAVAFWSGAKTQARHCSSPIHLQAR